MSILSFFFGMLALGVLVGILYFLRVAGYLPLRQWEWHALGFPDIQTKLSREMAEVQATQQALDQKMEAVGQSRVELFRQFKRSIHELRAEWEELDRDPKITQEWKKDIHYIYQMCYRDMVDNLPPPYRPQVDRGGQGGGQGVYKEGEDV